MMHSTRKKFIIFTAMFFAVITLVSAMVLGLSANERIDAMKEIREAFDDKYKIGESYLLKDDGYIGIEVELTTYYDYETFGVAQPVLKGTNIALYYVNTNTERVGQETDVNIISDLLSRGFAVVTVDYFNDPRAKAQALDWSSQEVRKHVINGSCFSDKTVFPSGTYKDNYVLPAGYNVTPFAAFWSIDEPGADGTLERIVEVWNNDFRGVHGNVIVNWTRSETDKNGNEAVIQKQTQTGLDGSAPQWYSDAAGKNPVDKDSPDAKYIKIKHTLAQSITDCTTKDGSPISLDLDMHIVYPANPEKRVPVIMQSGSSEYLTTGKTGEDTRPQHNGYLFRGYAAVLYDHLYVPMAHNQYYGYFDGSKDASVTGDHASYSLYFINNTKVDTAAVRYIRYLTLTDPEKYSFDLDGIGVYGNSKGGMFMFVGSADLREYTELREGMTLAESIDARINDYTTNRYAIGHHGETRYQNGLTEDYTVGNYTVRGGKLQPWTTYIDENGVEREILSYVSYIYVANAGNASSIKEGHAPIFNVMCLADPLGNCYGNSNQIATATKNLDVPSLNFVVDVGHTFTYGKDVYYDVDTYDAMFDFSDYYLKKSAVKVIYTDPSVSFAGMDTTTPIIIKFSGAVNREELDKITLRDSKGNLVSGIIWESSYGNTEWTLIHRGLLGGEEYTLTIPAGFKGDNGTPMTEDFVATYRTESEDRLSATYVTTAIGTYVTVKKADVSFNSGVMLRFLVENDAANIASVTEVVSYNVSNPDASTLGNKIASVNLYGRGVYECDVSDEMSDIAIGDSKTFLLKTEKASGIFDVSSQNFGSSISKLGNAQFAVAELSTAPDGNNTPAAKVHITTNTRPDGTSNYFNSNYYPSFYTVLNNSGLFDKITAGDLGRKYTVSVKVFDTISREINLKISSATSSTNKILDFDYTYFTVETEANKWTEISFEYTVLAPLYGLTALSSKSLTVSLAGDGDRESPIYISELNVTETVTDMTVSEVYVATYDDGSTYNAPKSEKPFSIGSVNYDTLGAALAAAKSGDVIVANRNYVMTESFTGLEKLSTLTLDLSGYKIYLNGSTPLFNARATSTSVQKTTVTVKNGAIYIGNSSVVTYGGSSSAGNGKVFDFNFIDVNFIATDLAMAKKLITESTVSGANSISANFNFDGCEFRIEKGKLPNNPITILPSGDEKLNLAYTLNGGKIVLDTMHNVTLWESHKVVTVKSSETEQTVITLPACMPFGETNVRLDNKICTYFAKTENLGITTYVAEESPNSTPYGIVPSDYSDAKKYPFVSFDKDGNFLGANEKLLGVNGSGGAFERARTFLQDNGYKNGSFEDPDATVYIIARRDYTLYSDEYFNNLAQLQGTVVFDLADNTISQGACSAAIFAAGSKTWGSAAGEKVFPVTVKVQNGTLLASKTGVISMSVWDSSGTGAVADKEFDLTFNNVTFGFAEGATTSILLATYQNATSTSVASKFKVELNDCVFDYTTTTLASATTLFNTNTANKYIDVDYTVNGGSILGGAFNNITIANNTGSYTSSVVFGTGADGEYTILTVNKGVSVAIGNYATAKGEVLGYSFESSSDNTDVYKLGKNELVTKYGVIPEEYADKNAYPFIIFDGKGNFVKAASLWIGTNGGALGSAYSHLEGNAWDATLGKYTYNGGEAREAIIYLRRDYTMSSSDVKFNNFGYIKGKVTLDLGGHTLSQGKSSTYMFSLEAKSASPTTLNVINGTVLASSKRLVYVYSSSSAAGKRSELNFTGVTVGLVEGSSISGLLYTSGKSSSNTNICEFYVSFNDCIFDFETNASSASSFTMFPNATTSNYCKVVTTVNGGEIRLGSNNNITISDASFTNGSSLNFGKGSDGKYTTLTLDSTTVTSDSFNTTEGAMKFVKINDSKYILASVTNPYGADIPQEYGYAENYPFIVLDQNGNFLAAYDTLYGSNSGMAGKICYTHLKGNEWDAEKQQWVGEITGCIILLRRDYTIGADEYFNNWSAARGTVTFDLCGYSINQTKDARSDALFKITGKTADGDVFPTTIIVKNGSINMYKSTVLSIDCYSKSELIPNKICTITFDGVRFGLSKGATITNLLITAKTTDNGAYTVPFFVNYNDCEFDLVTNSNGKVISLFNNNATADKYVSCKLAVNGGVIKALSSELVDFWSLSDSDNSSVIFGTGADGYIRLLLPTGATAPNTVFPTENGNCMFVKTSSEGETNIYEFKAEEVVKIDFTPKMSLTLDRDLVFNVYIPVRDFLLGFTLDGKDSGEYDLVEVTLDDGKYYRISIPLNASEACRNITLKVRVALSGEKTATGTFNFGVIKYAEKVLAADFDIEKTLVRDVLAYIRAAYVFFKVEDAESIAKINAILGEGYDEQNMPQLNGSAEVNVNGLDGAALVLDATPSIRFTLPNGADAGRYEFFINGVKVKTELSADGKYIYLDVYAYALCETVTYTIDGVESGSYHLNAYYEWSKTQNYEGLENLVLRFAKYCESAALYKNHSTSD